MHCHSQGRQQLRLEIKTKQPEKKQQQRYRTDRRVGGGVGVVEGEKSCYSVFGFERDAQGSADECTHMCRGLKGKYFRVTVKAHS